MLPASVTAVCNSAYASGTLQSIVLDVENLTSFSQWIFAPDTVWESVSRLYESPEQAIVSAVIFPFNVVETLSLDKTTWSKVKVGNVYAPNSQGICLNKRQTDKLSLGFTASTFVLAGPEPSAGFEFLDYAPYIKTKIWVPFCGWVDIDYGTYRGHQLSLRYTVNPLDGSCVAFICDDTDGFTILTTNGQMGLVVDISSSNLSTNTLSGAFKMFMGSLTTGFSAFSTFTNPDSTAAQKWSVVSGGINAFNESVAEMGRCEINHGSPVSTASFNTIVEPYVLYFYKVAANSPSDYVSYAGRPCGQSGAVSAVGTGYFLEMGNPVVPLATHMTSTERDMIEGALKEGVYR